MKRKKRSTRDRRTSKRPINDLVVPNARGKDTKGGDSVSRALDGIFKATATAAQKVG
jgi:hypothetical protein